MYQDTIEITIHKSLVCKTWSILHDLSDRLDIDMYVVGKDNSFDIEVSGEEFNCKLFIDFVKAIYLRDGNMYDILCDIKLILNNSSKFAMGKI